MIQRLCCGITAVVWGAAAVALCIGGTSPDDAPRTVVIGVERETQTPAQWTAERIREGYAATDAADRARACAATPEQLRAAAPHTSYDSARYDVETAIVTLKALCQS